ncbi:DHS-like NAD/FAD-binding domain-containing protein [Microthyrium microscopicum]|uniref:protein acetyllysine N-acetyltransferase n=1 Tax=Microthyrium microscopicum TaxID=703497 RepID=A0A6A6U7J7_9PEZI|nr:DHS-like NAD/FAD-binding domain-containing protein [Microthyrium microscopicum]
MDLTAPKIAELEQFDPPDRVDSFATELANQIKNGKHFIAFTGAGVSTSAGIPDFRGPEGAWTARAQGRQLDFKHTTTLQAVPSPTHMALVELQDRGLLKYLISQNCDGLHRRSGILPDRISELHGNSNREHCKDCGKEFIRDFRAVATYEKSATDHRTGRKCTRCGGALHDTIINFGEDLPPQALKLALKHARKADLCLALGSSLMVSPANSIPKIVGKNKNANLAICNLQKTPIDENAQLRIHTKVDDLMICLMDKLDIPIPDFILRRQLVVEMTTQAKEQHQLKIYGVDVDQTPVSFLQSVKLENSRRPAKSEPFIFNIRDKLEPGSKLNLELEFMGHYGEPNLIIGHGFSGEEAQHSIYELDYNPRNGQWNITSH